MFKSNTVCFITGGSRGFGRGVAETFAKEISNNQNVRCAVVLMARSEEGLQETKKSMTSVCPFGNLEVHCVAGDLSDMDSLDNLVQKSLGIVSPSDYSTAVLINNAGTVGNTSKSTIEHNDLFHIKGHLDMNVSSFLYLTSCFVSKFKPTSKKVFVVNISTKAAIQPYSHMSLYCAGKAARDMIYRVVAAENPEIRSLNYAPGPMDTKMAHEIKDNTACEQIKQWFTKILSEGTAVDIGESSSKLLKLLMEDTFENGAHIDFYDE